MSIYPVHFTVLPTVLNGEPIGLAVDENGRLIIVGTLTGVVTGPLTNTELRATPVPVSGTVTASGPLTDTELRATAVPVSGPLTDAEIRATALPVSGPLTDTELRATSVPITPTPSSSVACATISATTTPAALAAQACKSLLIQNDPDSTEDVLFGSSAAQYMQLVPGASVVVRVSNANLVYVKTAQNTADVNTFASV